MKILIIGSKGFIGLHCLHYFAAVHEVWQCDVVADYVSKNYYIVDATNADYNDIFQSEKFDICINCSGAASVPDSIKNPQRDFTLNVVNVFKQLDAIRKFNKECKYINISSAAVYGNPKKLPIKESHTLNPISPYGTHKIMAEQVCQSFFQNFGVHTISLRVFSAYGPGLKKQLFWDLYHKMNTNKKVELYGTGEETRDFIYIKDLLNAIDCIINKASFNAEIVNVSNGLEHKIKDVVKFFYKHITPDVDVIFTGDERKGDPSFWKADITLLKSYGHTQNYSIKKGIKNYIEWLKEIK